MEVKKVILAIQVVGMVFALFMLYITFLHQIRKEFTVKESIFWFGAWGAFLFMSIFPRALDFFIKNVLNFSRRLDFFIIIGFMFIIGLLFHTYTIMRKNQNEVEEIVRKIAIDKSNKK